MVYGTYMRTFINPIVKNKINFTNLSAATYHGRFRPSERLPPMILTGLIRPSDTDNYVSQICYIILLKNPIAVYDRSTIIICSMPPTVTIIGVLASSVTCNVHMVYFICTNNATCNMHPVYFICTNPSVSITNYN